MIRKQIKKEIVLSLISPKLAVNYSNVLTPTKPSEIESTNILINNDLKNLHEDTRELFKTERPELKQICDYYFDGSGKATRPLVICAWARALNRHYAFLNNKTEENANLLASQRQIALIAEMIHVASLIHDDIVDNSDLRRGKTSVNAQWGCHKAVMAGDYVLAISSKALSQLGNTNVVETLSEVLEDLVKGELMQFGSKETENERFQHYTTKTYRKTASLFANSCKSVALLLIEKDNKSLETKNTEQKELVKLSFEFGKNLGIAFQLIDDVLDFTSHSETLGKPGIGADLRLGLATAPVLFAVSKYPQLNAMIMRRFSHKDDVKNAFEFVIKSDGIKETQYLALKYCENAENCLKKLHQGQETEFLRHLIRKLIIREK